MQSKAIASDQGVLPFRDTLSQALGLLPSMTLPGLIAFGIWIGLSFIPRSFGDSVMTRLITSNLIRVPLFIVGSFISAAFIFMIYGKVSSKPISFFRALHAAIANSKLVVWFSAGAMTWYLMMLIPVTLALVVPLAIFEMHDSVRLLLAGGFFLNALVFAYVAARLFLALPAFLLSEKGRQTSFGKCATLARPYFWPILLIVCVWILPSTAIYAAKTIDPARTFELHNEVWRVLHIGWRTIGQLMVAAVGTVLFVQQNGHSHGKAAADP